MNTQLTNSEYDLHRATAPYHQLPSSGLSRGVANGQFLSKTANQLRIEQDWLTAVLDEKLPDHEKAYAVFKQMVAGAFPDFGTAMVKYWWHSEITKRGKDLLTTIVEIRNTNDSLTMMRPVDFLQIKTDLHSTPSEAKGPVNARHLLPKDIYSIDSFRAESDLLTDLLDLTSISYSDGVYVASYDTENRSGQVLVDVDEYVEMTATAITNCIKGVSGNKLRAMKEAIEVGSRFLANYRHLTNVNVLSCLVRPITGIEILTTEQPLSGIPYKAAMNDGCLQIIINTPHVSKLSDI